MTIDEAFVAIAHPQMTVQRWNAQSTPYWEELEALLGAAGAKGKLARIIDVLDGTESDDDELDDPDLKAQLHLIPYDALGKEGWTTIWVDGGKDNMCKEPAMTWHATYE